MKWFSLQGSPAAVLMVCTMGLFSACVPTPPPPPVIFFDRTGDVIDDGELESDRTRYYAGAEWIDSGTANGTVPVFFIAKFDANGNAVWRKRFPENPDANWLAQYAGLAKRDVDRFRAFDIEVSANGDVYVLGAGPSQTQIMASVLQHDPEYREHEQTLLKYDASGNLQWSRVIGGLDFQSSQFSGVKDFAVIDDQIIVEDKIYDPAGDVVRTFSRPIAGAARLGNYLFRVLNDCVGSGHSTASCGGISGYSFWAMDVVGDAGFSRFQQTDSATITSYVSEPHAVAVLTSTRLNLDNVYGLRLHDDSFSIAQQVTIENLFGVDYWQIGVVSPGGNSVKDQQPVVLGIPGETGAFYLVDFVAAQQNILVAKLDQDFNLLWSNFHGMSGVESGMLSASYKMERLADGSAALFLRDGAKYNIFRFADDGTLLSQDYYRLPEQFPLMSVSAAENSDYIVLTRTASETQSAFVPVESIALP